VSYMTVTSTVVCQEWQAGVITSLFTSLSAATPKRQRAHRRHTTGKCRAPAAACGRAAVRAALAAGESVNEVEAAGCTPLHSAAYEGWLEGAELLLSLGAQVDASNNAGDRPWHWAHNLGHTAMLTLLEKARPAAPRARRRAPRARAAAARLRAPLTRMIAPTPATRCTQHTATTDTFPA